MGDSASNILSEDGSTRAAARASAIEFDDAALVQRSRGGDMQAFGSLVAKYQDRVLNAILRLCGNQADAEELAQETFVKALERLSQFRGQSKFYTWLFRIAVNMAISQRRRGGRIRFHPLGGGDELESSQAAALTAAVARRREAGPAASAIAAETAHRVMDALRQLEDEFRVVVVLRDIEEMDYTQIADVLNVPVGTVKSRLHRARLMLRGRLASLAD